MCLYTHLKLPISQRTNSKSTYIWVPYAVRSSFYLFVSSCPPGRLRIPGRLLRLFAMTNSCTHKLYAASSGRRRKPYRSATSSSNNYYHLQKKKIVLDRQVTKKNQCNSLMKNNNAICFLKSKGKSR